MILACIRNQHKEKHGVRLWAFKTLQIFRSKPAPEPFGKVNVCHNNSLNSQNLDVAVFISHLSQKYYAKVTDNNLFCLTQGQKWHKP